jgi:hypothetical protein
MLRIILFAMDCVNHIKYIVIIIVLSFQTFLQSFEIDSINVSSMCTENKILKLRTLSKAPQTE